MDLRKQNEGSREFGLAIGCQNFEHKKVGIDQYIWSSKIGSESRSYFGIKWPRLGYGVVHFSHFSAAAAAAKFSPKNPFLKFKGGANYSFLCPVPQNIIDLIQRYTKLGAKWKKRV